MQLSTLRQILTHQSSTIATFARSVELEQISDADIAPAQRQKIMADLKDIEIRMDALRKMLFNLEK